MSNALQRVAVIGGVRIPFCRAGGPYADSTNLDMLVATLQGLSARYGLAGAKIDEVIAGAVTTHSKDWNLAREAVLGTDLSPLTPAITLQQACATSLQAALISAAKIATGQIDCAIAAGSDTASDAPITFTRKFAQRLVKLSKARDFQSRLEALRGFSLRELVPQSPRAAEPRTGLSMGEHCERMAREWQITRAAQDAFALDSHRKAWQAWEQGLFDEMVVPFAGVTRDDNLRPTSTPEQLAKLKPSFAADGTLTAANSTPLTDGAASVLLASEEWAKARGLPIQCYLTTGRAAAVDFVNDEGLLMAPTVAVAELLQRTGLALQDFDLYEIHEAFAAQVLCTLKAWEDERYCRERLGLGGALGSIDPAKINPLGSSVAVGHPFAATGARVLATAAQQLEQRGGGRALLSVCTAGGMGVAAILER
jgi:acetyl-CoA C-acetyltransferase